MPWFLQPKKSSQHRVAAIALYRALLARCSSAPLADDEKISLRNAICNKFRKSKKLQSPFQLGLVYKAGYETLDHLDASISRDSSSIESLKTLVRTLPRGLTRALPKHRPSAQPVSSKKLLACLPHEKAVLNVRPHTKVSGPRHVPILASANGVPFLRIKKPQPPSLSRVLRQKLANRIERFHRKVEINNYWLPIATQEDEWDVMMNNLLQENRDRCKWVDACKEADWQNQEAQTKDMDRNTAIAEKMLNIVDQETALALKEGQKIIRGRKSKPIRPRR